MMTLPYPLFATMVGKHDTGKYAGVFVVSISLGRVGAPMFVGGAIDIGARFMPATKGYPMMWPAAAVFAILAWLALGHTKASVEHT